MKKTNFEGVTPYTGETQYLPAGGYKCVILSARCDILRSGREQLILAIDIADGEYEGYFTKRFNELKVANSNAKYPNSGLFRIFTEDYNNPNLSSSILAGLKTSLEQSNNGFKWDDNERTLVGKKIGVVFGEEEYRGQDEKIKVTVKPRYARSWDKVEEAEIPKKKELGIKGTDADFITVEDTDDLPF